jgi:hypothetical protein
MDYLLFDADNPSASGDLDSLTWSDLAMHYASEIQTELRQKPFSQDAIISTLGHYAHYMIFANVNRCIYANAPELCLIARSYSLNIAVYQVDPHSSQHYALNQDFYGNPNNSENVVYLLYNGIHYQRIITDNRYYSVINDTLTDSHSSNDECCKIDISIAMDQSYQNDFAIGRIEVEELLFITEESTSNLYCQVCKDDSNSLTFLESISHVSFNFTQVVSYENVSNEASVTHATIQEATNDSIFDDLALACE